MLACIPRHQNFSSQHLVCTTRVLEVVPPLALPMPPSQPYTHKGVSVSMATRYPTPAELDAFAQRTANSPLSITIFPSNVRVPQHKQLNRTVNGLDTTGQRYSPYSHPPSGGSRGLLAVVKGSAAVAKAVAPPPWGGVARVSPSHEAVAAVARSDSGFVLGVPPPQSGLAFSGAVLPTQSADMAKVGYLEGGDYGVWQHKHPHHQPQPHHQLQQQYQQGSLRMFSSNQGGMGAESMVGQSPQSSLPSCRPHPLSAGAGGAADFSLGPRYHGLSWDGLAAAAPLTDCYAQELALPRDTGHPHPQAHPHNCLDPHHHHHRPNPPQCHPPTTGQQAYSTEHGVCCGGMGPHGAGQGLGPGLCHASVLSSSLQSLECLISEIHPPCIKERMLGRGYEALGLARLLEQHHHPHLHPHFHPHPNIQLYR
ncbi:unnamed protein product [Lota lota]